jgi:type IV pilus assembly protein PilV
LADYDLREWKRQVETYLPLADANVFIAPGDSDAAGNNRRQLGVMISWRESEKTQDSDYITSLNAATDGGAVSCPADRTCHLQYIPVAGRCAPYKATPSSPSLYFCAGS